MTMLLLQLMLPPYGSGREITMKYGIYFAYWEKEWKTDLIPYIRKVRDLGFDVLEISCASLVHASREDLTLLKQAAADNGVILTAGYGPGPAENLASPDPAIVSNAIALYTDILQKLEYLEIHTIGGGIYSYWPVDYTQPIDKPGDWARSVANVRKVGKIAADCGIRYCLEVLNRFEGYLLNTAEEAKQFVEEVGLPSVMIMLDTFHMNIEEDNMADAIRLAGDKLGHFHAGENNRRVPGKGGLNWAAVGSALREIGYTGAVVMEPFVLQGGTVGRDIRVWRDLSHGADTARLDSDAAGSVAFLRHVFSGPYDSL